MAEKAPADDGQKQNDQNDAELSDLLNNFGKSRPVAEGSSQSTTDASAELDVPLVDDEMAKRAAAEFEHMLKQMAEMQSAVFQQTQNMAEGGEVPQLPPDLPDDFDPQIASQEAKALLDSINALAQRAKGVASAEDKDSLMENMEALHSEGLQNDFMPFMQQMMCSLLSKDVMYPSLLEMKEKYPEYLEKNKETLSKEDSERYSKQNELINEICTEFESESEQDTDEAKGRRFEKIMMLLQQMQMCGFPPQELVGSLPPGWSVDQESGLPTVVDSGAAADACSIM